MFYHEALDYIRRIEADGSDYGLERERELLDILGSPDTAYPVIHVAGTNGKGSVCAMLTAVLAAAGYRVGTYNSPSVLRYNERFRLNGAPLADDKVARYMTEVRDAVEKERAARDAAACEADGEGRPMRGFRPTAFEQETALALAAFKREKCDVAVLETGLGGRWDATNAVREKTLAVITKIGLDHCALLGDTLREIAGEKAAIIRGAAVTCPQEKEAADVIYPLAERVSGVPHLLERTPLGQRFEYHGEEYATVGDHQLINAALVIDAAEMLRERGFDIPQAALKEGLKSAVWHARFEVLTERNIAHSPYDIVVSHGKTLVLDGAHNPQGARALAETLAEVAAYRSRHGRACRQGLRRGAAGGAAFGADGVYGDTRFPESAFGRGVMRSCGKGVGSVRRGVRGSARRGGQSACLRCRGRGRVRFADSLSRDRGEGRGGRLRAVPAR